MVRITSDVPSIAFRLCRLVLLFSLKKLACSQSNQSHLHIHTFKMGLIDKLQASTCPWSKLHPTPLHTCIPYPHTPNDKLTSIFRARAVPSRAALRPPQAPQHLLHRRPIRRRGIRLQRQHRCQFANQHNLETINRKLASIREKWAFGIAMAVLIS